MTGGRGRAKGLAVLSARHGAAAGREKDEDMLRLHVLLTFGNRGGKG